MKRLPIAAAAVLAGALPFQKETESSECKEPPCAVGPRLNMPEQPHALDELPGYEGGGDTVVMNTSPIVEIKRGSPLHLELLQRGVSELGEEF